MKSAARFRLPTPALEALGARATVVGTTPAVFRMQGPGAVDCLQGLLTNDIVRPGPGGVIYGALLTPKGMIVVDFWVLRDEAGLTLVAERDGRDTSLELFRRQLPPRLARIMDVSDRWAARWLIGTASQAALERAGLPWPAAPGRLEAEGEILLARPGPAAPMAALLLGPAESVTECDRRLSAEGTEAGAPELLDVARIMAGWPTLGREIGEKTLPQEVRFDEIDGVSYTKGCYIGQETVARVHFRGHPNRYLRGLRWEGGIPSDLTVHSNGRAVGRVTSVVESAGVSVGLAVLRREVTPGQVVRIGEAGAARVEDLPFAWPETDKRPGLG